MAYDGSIIIETGIDTGGFTEGLARLETLAAQALEACGIQMAQRLADGIAGSAGAVEAGTQVLAAAAAGAMAAAAGQMDAAGESLVEGLWGGMQGASGWLASKISDWCAGIVNTIKGALGIASPAKVLADEVGRWMPPGIALGFEAALPGAQREMVSSVRAMASAMLAEATGVAPGAFAPRQAALGGAGSSVVLNQTVYTHDSLSPYELAQEAEAFAERERWRIR